MDEFKQAVSSTLKSLSKILVKTLLPAIIIIIMLASIVYVIFLDEGGYKHYSFDSYGGDNSGGIGGGTSTDTDEEREKVDNVRFVIEELVKSISIDTIKESKNNKGGYAFYAFNKNKSDLITIDEKIDEILETYPKVYDAILRNISEYEINEIEKRDGITDLRSDEEKKAEKARELLKKFVTAELKTKYPDLRTEEEIRNKEEIDEKELQGAIKIVRNNSENNQKLKNSSAKLEYTITKDTEILTYLPYEQFKALNTIEEARKHFTLKKSENEEDKEKEEEVVDLIVYGWKKTTTTITHTISPGGSDTEVTETYELYEVKMDYREQIKGKPEIVQGYAYDMPAGFLWSIFLTGESFEFVEKLADLVIKETEIVIEAQDNTRVTVETEVTSYTEVQIEYHTREVENEDGTTSIETYPVEVYITHTITKTVEIEETRTELNWVYTETWVQTYKRFYVTNTNNQGVPSDWQTTTESKELDAESIKELPKDATDGTIQGAGIQTNSTVIRNDIYIYVNYEKQERQDIDEEHNFITYFNNSGKSRKLILEVTSWLNDLLRTHEKTAELEKLFKYLLYKATGWDYGVTTISFTEYDFEDFESSHMSSGTNCPRYFQSTDLTGKDMPWKNNPYNLGKDKTGTIGADGCGACALAMVASGLTGQAITPNVIVEYLNNLGINTVYNGAKCVEEVKKLYRLECETISDDKEKIDKALDEGKCLVFSIGAGGGVYTGDGHYILCYGRNGDMYYVLDSSKYYNTDVLYTFDEVFSSLHQGIFAIGK